MESIVLGFDDKPDDIKLGGRPLRLSNPSKSSVDFIYDSGSARLVSDDDYGDSWGVKYWEPLLHDKNVSDLYLDNVDLYMLLRTPPNITSILLSNLSHIQRVESWVTGEKNGKNHEDMTLRYTGNHTKLSPSLDSVSLNITHLQIPLSQDIGDLVSRHPHLESVGIDLDKMHLTHFPLPAIVWSSNKHRLRMLPSSNIIGTIHYSTHNTSLLKL